MIADGEYRAAIEIFGSVQREFEELGMADSVALVAVDAAHALVLDGRPNEVAPFCEAAINYFTSARLSYTRAAVTALAYLREAAESQKLTIANVHNLRTYLGALRDQPTLPFHPI